MPDALRRERSWANTATNPVKACGAGAAAEAALGCDSCCNVCVWVPLVKRHQQQCNKYSNRSCRRSDLIWQKDPKQRLSVVCVCVSIPLSESAAALVTKVSEPRGATGVSDHLALSDHLAVLALRKNRIGMEWNGMRRIGRRRIGRGME